MKVAEILSLVGKRNLVINPAKRRLLASHTVADLEKYARRKLPRSIFDYLQGGAGAERSLAANVEAFGRYSLVPRSLSDVSKVDTSVDLLGEQYDAPIGLAPTGYTRMLAPAGEPAVAAAAGAANLPYALSTMATTTLEDLTTACAPRNLWFQLYIFKDRSTTEDMIARADASGYRVLEIAIDSAVGGNRVRDRRNGLTIPPQLTLSSLIDIGRKPGYWTGVVTQPSLRFDNIAKSAPEFGGGSTAYINDQFDPSVSWSDIRKIRELWPGKLVIKGPVSPDDAQRCVDLGADGVQLSNHGGRQLDQLVPPVDMIADVRKAVGEDVTILMDSGVRTGVDVAIALALGADAVMIGRPYLWGLIAGGRAGVSHVIGLLRRDLEQTMALLGVTTLQELREQGPSIVRRFADR
ncbi:alpha-hydroxy acid oxidase [Saxibacter everestensis]|uniref:Alpha-hydroxy acid oxidase n=1 Tax=Saxibacter everestensis TaxID=2909229 RepID=A0ABY8QTK1_9MICO|nr:alpha-hydroxy acid oxidase [Brevibacteriaceae bacterium ZFBP1038]